MVEKIDSREMNSIGFPDWSSQPVQLFNLQIETTVDGVSCITRIEGLLPSQMTQAAAWINGKTREFPECPMMFDYTPVKALGPSADAEVV